MVERVIVGDLVSSDLSRVRRDGGIGTAVGSFGHESVFIADQCLRVELEGFTHEFGDARGLLARFIGNYKTDHLPPNDNFVNHASPEASNSGAQLLVEAIH